MERAKSAAAAVCTRTLAVAALILCLCQVTLAQDLSGEEEDLGFEEEGEAEGRAVEPAQGDDDSLTPPDEAGTAALVEANASQSTSRPPAPPPDTEQKNGFVKPLSESTLAWAGSLEVDVGYAQYTFATAALNREEVHDFRGRFVFGPTLNYDFATDWFVAARGEAVMWIREQFGVYQINVDDVFAQVGKRGLFDLKVGRFRAWRVYHRGLGFDLFTLEDTGACAQNPCTSDAGTFGPHTYEVSFLYDRETAGRAAFHLYPTTWSGLELIATYGQGGVSNTWGVRGAGMIHFDFVRVMGAAEFRAARPREEASALDPNGVTVPCDNCGVSERVGFGGGIELTLRPVEIGLNIARGISDIYTVTTGDFDEGGSNTTTSIGGYAELDVGSLTWQGSLILGFGLHRTEALAVNENFSEHWQGAAYIAYPLGFNAAMVKLVVSRSQLTGLTLVDEDNRVFNESQSAMTAARIRLAYPF